MLSISESQAAGGHHWPGDQQSIAGLLQPIDTPRAKTDFAKADLAKN
jgi:hypothetical protein